MSSATTTTRTRTRSPFLSMHLLGGAMALYGAIGLILLATPWRQFALDHSVAELVSRTDRRVNNAVTGSVDLPMAIAGSAVVLIAGLWIAILVPYVIHRSRDAMLATIAANMDPS